MPLPVAVIVVTWNSREDIRRSLPAVLAQQPAEVVVVDNASSDGTRTLLRQEFPRVKLIEHSENRGFSAGCNAGIAASAAPYVLLLNADATLAPGYLDCLLAALEREPRAASAIGKLVYGAAGERYIDSAGIVLRRHAMSPLDRGHGEIDRGQFDRPEEIFGPSGAAALYRRAALAAVGPEIFDEDLFAYYEDVDLAWRLRRLGWRHLYEPAALAEHPRRGPDDKPVAISGRAFANRLLVWLKNDPIWHLALVGPLLTTRELARFVRLAWRRPELVPEITASLRRLPAILRKRRHLRSSRVASKPATTHVS